MDAFPAKGTSWEDLEGELRALRAEDPTSTIGLHGPDDAWKVATAAHAMFFNTNALGGSRMPSLWKMNNDLCAWACDLMHGGPDARGSITTGGSESIFCAVHAIREWARDLKPEIAEPELVVPYSAHAGFSKACHYLGLTLKRVPVGADYRADVAAMEAAITPNTIGLVGSAPCWPYGLFDPIPELAGLALERGLWMHVDACVGGFIAPFAKELGYSFPDWDLGVPGVCSISADLHKYGFAPMPASMIVYRSADLHAYQPYNVEDWPTGPYRTETVVGSRQGGAIAAAWAGMRYLGEEGFLASTAGIMRTKARLTEGINAIPGLKVLENDLSLLAYGADGELFDTATIAGGLRERGWYVMGSLQPPLVNLPLSPSSDEEIDAYLSALRDVVDGITEQTRSEGTLNYAS